MAVITDKLFKAEPLKVVIYFEDNLTYEIQSNVIGDRALLSIDFSNLELNNTVNPLGIVTSNTVNIQIYDKRDSLLPTNPNSPYYGKLVNGLKLEIQMLLGGEWVPYGTYFTTLFSGSYSGGSSGLNIVTGEDILNTIGNLDVPKILVYANIPIGELITTVFNNLEIEGIEVYIDPQIDTSMLYGVLPGTKMRDFINKAAQILFARVVVSRDNIVCWVPSLEISLLLNLIEIDYNMITSLQNKNTSNINYNRILVQYTEQGDMVENIIYLSGNNILSSGDNTLDNILFNRRVFAIKDVLVDSSSGGHILNTKFEAFQDGMILHLTVDGDPIPDANITIKGVTPSDSTKKETLNILSATKIGGLEFTLDTGILMSKQDAYELCVKILDYLQKVNKEITIDTTILTMQLAVGDKLIIRDTGLVYDGTYKIINQTIKYLENYSMYLTALRLL